MPPRRPVLAAAASLLTAGCLGPVRSLTGSDTDCVSGFSVHADPFRPADRLPTAFSAAQRDLVDRIVESGATELETYAGDPPFRDGIYTAANGRYYRTAVERVGTTEVPAHRLDITWERGREAPDEASVVAFTALPEMDRRVLRLAIRGPEVGGGERRGHPSERLSLRDAPMPYPNGTDESRLVNRAETWVRWNDRTYRVTSGEPATTSRYTYRCDVTAVAESASDFRDYVAREYLIRLTDLTDAERSILQQAADDTYQECEPASDGLARLRDRLPDERRLPHPYDQSWFVRFEEAPYELEITNWIR